MNELNQEKWSLALINYANSVGRLQAIARLSQIKNIGYEDIIKNDLALLDDFYTYLDSDEQTKLKEYIKNTFDYVEK